MISVLALCIYHLNRETGYSNVLSSWLPNQMISLILIFGFLCRSSFRYPDDQKILHSNVLCTITLLASFKANLTLFQPILPFWHLRIQCIIPKNLLKRFSFEIVSYYPFPSPLCVVHKSEKAPGLTLVDIKFPLFFRNDSKFFSLSREVIRLKLEYNLYQLSPQETHCEDHKNPEQAHQLSVRKFLFEISF